MHRTKLVARAALTIGIALVATGAGAATFRVPQDHASIQAGVVAAAPGDTVLVAPGRYEELIRMKKGVVLLSADGPDSTVLVSPGLSEKLVQERILECGEGIGPDTVIEGFTFDAGGIAGAAIFCEQASPTIRGNVIRGFGWGINLRYSEALIEGNIIEGCTSFGVLVFASSPVLARNVIRNTSGRAISISGKESSPVIGGSPERTNRIHANHQANVHNGSRNDIDATWNDWGWEDAAEMDRKGWPADIVKIIDGNDRGRTHRGRGKVDYRNWVRPAPEEPAADVASLGARAVVPALIVIVLAAGLWMIARRRRAVGGSG